MKTLLTVAALAALAAPSRAHAEDIAAYQADGEADAAAADARVTALDEAFGKAVGQAVGELLDADTRRQSKSVIDRELIGHARLWIATFKVVKEAVVDDRKQVQVSVRVDRDKLRARLAELNIASKTGDGPAVTVLLRVATPDAVHATFGRGADKDVPGLAGLTSALRRASFTVKRAPATGPAARPDGELPIGDDAADALAADAKADLVAIAGVQVGAP
ncbi:MAG TPA: hypothetical protein VFP84_39485, partial [Kofleriaceae bacterium]|nr:hypothetical protein [Kofleriaceae bacterium]